MAFGLLVAPLVLWVLTPSLPVHLESAEGFHWAGAESGTGRPLLLRVQRDAHQIVAGSDRNALAEDVPCYDGVVAPLLDAARARGRIEDLSLHAGFFHRLTVRFDDLGGGAATYLYRCGPHGVQPLLSWHSLPGFGVRSLAIIWLLWIAACFAAFRLWRARRMRERVPRRSSDGM
jgi:hypothetical protein